MRPRSRVLDIPETDRYAVVELGDRGDHHFRFPSYALAGRIVEWMAESDGTGISGGVLYSGAVIGVFWWHRAFRLDAQIKPRASDEEIDDFAEDVVDELQEERYSFAEIATLGQACDEQLASWVRSRTEAIKQARDFTEAEAEAT